MKIAVLGCGNMGGAIADGLYKKHGDGLMFEVWDTVAAKAEAIKFAKAKDPIHWFDDGESEPDIVLIAVKPQVIREALSVFKIAGKNTVWISIAAGVSIEKLEEWLPAQAKIIRAMPNTPALIGEGCCLYSLNGLCGDGERKKISYIFEAVGVSYEIPESMMNAATGLSGSGVAFVYTIIEAFAEAGVAAGLPYETALNCAAKTLLGSAKMVLETGESTSALKAKVMSPGGTTATGNFVLEQSGVRNAVMSAVIASAQKAEELGNALQSV